MKPDDDTFNAVGLTDVDLKHAGDIAGPIIKELDQRLTDIANTETEGLNQIGSLTFSGLIAVAIAEELAAMAAFAFATASAISRGKTDVEDFDKEMADKIVLKWIEKRLAEPFDE